MQKEIQIFAKEQQIKVIDNILCSLCSLELNKNGRKYLKRMKERIQRDIDHLKIQEENNEHQSVSSFDDKIQLPDSFRIS